MDRQHRARFFRRIAFGVLAALGLFAVAAVAAVWLIAGRVGLTGWASPVLAMLVLFVAGAALIRMFGAMRRFASPLAAVMDAADRVAEGDYAVRVRGYGPPPIRALARSFNTMTERLQNADRLRRDLMADVAHELRTPLAVLQGRLEGLLDDVYSRDDRQISELLDETNVLSRLIEDLRMLALSDAGALPLQKEQTDVVALAHDVVRCMRTEAARKSAALELTAPSEAVVLELDPVRIREVLTNLLSNAVRHTTADHKVTVVVSRSADGATLSVSDKGEGMAPEAVARMFDRFYKGSTSRGSGLGLTIAKGIVQAHGGDISASSELGVGTTVTFTLPRSPA